MDFAQGSGSLQPTMNATSLGGRPGVTSDGARVLVASGAGAVLSGLTQVTAVWRMLDASTAARVALEYTADINSNNNAFSLTPNTGGSGRLAAISRGNGAGLTSVYGTETLASAATISVGFDLTTAGLGSIAFIRVNGTPLSLTSTLTAAVVGALGSSSLYMFGRGPTPSAGWPGTGGDLVIMQGIQQDADLAAVESYVADYGGFSRTLGRIMTVGDSLTRSNNAGTGGWRRYLESRLMLANIGWTPVGPFNDASTAMAQKDHGGLASDTAAARAANITAQVTAANPAVIIWGFGINDIGTGTSVATFQTNYLALLTAADAVVPTVKHIVQSIVVPTNAAGTTYAAEFAAANAWLATAMGGRARTTYVDVGSPVTDDNVHPVDGPTGYDVMGAAIYPVLLSVA